MITRLGRAEFSSTAGGHGPPMGHASTMDGESGVLASGKEAFVKRGPTFFALIVVSTILQTARPTRWVSDTHTVSSQM